jgi:hypothetical protein
VSPAVEQYLRDLVGRCDDVPLVDELVEADLGTPRATASIARAALAHVLDGQPDAIAARLRAELAEADRLAVWRARQGWFEFEQEWRAFSRGRSGHVPASELTRRRDYREAV